MKTADFSKQAENAAQNLIASNMPFIRKALVNSDDMRVKVKVELDIEMNDIGVVNIIPKLSCNVTHKHEDKHDMIIIDPSQPDMFEESDA